jgi:hypothetical protein
MTQGVLATERNAARVRPQRGIAEYGVTVGGVHALAGGTQIIRLWALYPATAAAEPYAARWPAIEQHLLQCYHRPRFLRSAIRPPGTHRGRWLPPRTPWEQLGVVGTIMGVLRGRPAVARARRSPTRLRVARSIVRGRS